MLTSNTDISSRYHEQGNRIAVFRFSPFMPSYLQIEILHISPQHGDNEGQHGNQEDGLRDALSENAVGLSAKHNGFLYVYSTGVRK